VSFGVRAAVGWTFACGFLRFISACGSVGSAVVSFGVGAAVGRTLAAVAGSCSYVVIVECHDEPFLFAPDIGLLMLRVARYLAAIRIEGVHPRSVGQTPPAMSVTR
jgi:hypothetical protein